MKVRPRKLDKQDKIRYLDSLYTAVSSLKTREDIKKFLRDLLTESERIMVGRRIVIAHQLLRDRSYDEIVQDLKVGKDTIMRVQRWLQDETRGYEKAIEELEKVFKKREEVRANNRKRTDDYYMKPFASLKRKYPMHFFLFNLFDKSSNN